MRCKVKITNDEPIFLHFTLNLALDGISYDSRTIITDINKLGLQDTTNYFSSVTRFRDKIKGYRDKKQA
jgi:hypothetical protein